MEIRKTQQILQKKIMKILVTGGAGFTSLLSNPVYNKDIFI